jgi:hypothetical protein
MDVSVVIPTYCRGTSLRTTIASLAASSCTGFGTFEVVIVDDGSPVMVQTALEGLDRALPMDVRIFRQENAGPAAARNRGFKLAHGSVVVFIDDDIEVPPSLLSGHWAAHKRHPRSVVFGQSLLPPGGDPILRRVLERLQGAVSSVEFERSPIVASGHLSVERGLFPNGQVYRGDLRTPAAEEYELSARLAALGIAAFRANHIVATHHARLELGWVCRQQYGHGRGCAEAVARAPETLNLPELRRIIQRVQSARRAPRSLFRRPALSPAGRKALLAVARAAGATGLTRPLAPALYRLAIAAHFVAGVRDGLCEFGVSDAGARTSPRDAPIGGEAC